MLRIPPVSTLIALLSFTFIIPCQADPMTLTPQEQQFIEAQRRILTPKPRLFEEKRRQAIWALRAFGYADSWVMRALDEVLADGAFGKVSGALELEAILATASLGAKSIRSFYALPEDDQYRDDMRARFLAPASTALYNLDMRLGLFKVDQDFATDRFLNFIAILEQVRHFSVLNEHTGRPLRDALEQTKHLFLRFARPHEVAKANLGDVQKLKALFDEVLAWDNQRATMAVRFLKPNSAPGGKGSTFPVPPASIESAQYENSPFAAAERNGDRALVMRLVCGDELDL